MSEKFDQDLLSRRNVELMRKAYEGVGKDDFQPAFDLVIEVVGIHDLAAFEVADRANDL